MCIEGEAARVSPGEAAYPIVFSWVGAKGASAGRRVREEDEVVGSVYAFERVRPEEDSKSTKNRETVGYCIAALECSGGQESSFKLKLKFKTLGLEQRVSNLIYTNTP